MALRKANITYTNMLGEEVTRIVKISSVVINYETAEAEIILKLWASETAAASGFQPEMRSARFQFDLTDQNVLVQVMSVSELIWSRLIDTPFIETANFDENGVLIGSKTVSINEVDGDLVEAV